MACSVFYLRQTIAVVYSNAISTFIHLFTSKSRTLSTVCRIDNQNFGRFSLNGFERSSSSIKPTTEHPFSAITVEFDVESPFLETNSRAKRTNYDKNRILYGKTIDNPDKQV